jgi:hypothetical protein
MIKLVSKFESILNSILEPKYFRENSNINAFDAFHKIEKVNIPLYKPERPTLNNTITLDSFVNNKRKDRLFSPGQNKNKPSRCDD